jgi:tetratricopeptide (TPR) repeat protein
MAEEQPATPADTQACLDRAAAALRANRVAAARRLAARVLAAEPDSARALQYLGVAAWREGRAGEAADLLARSLARDPSDAGCYLSLARARRAANDARGAAACLVDGIARFPADARLWNGLALARRDLKDIDGAVQAAERAVALRPDDAEMQLTLGAARHGAGNHAAALAAFDAALARDPDNLRAQQNRATLLKLLGRTAESQAAYQRVLDRAPLNADAWSSYVDMRTFAPDDPERFALERVYESGRLDARQRMKASFALGKVYEDIGHYDRAFWCYREGNRIKRASIDFDIQASVATFAATRRVVSAGLLAARRGAGHGDPAPIFIVGMPRSGTTLVEQVLASHPEVAGGGELYALSQQVAKGVPALGHVGAYPAWMPRLTDADLQHLGAAYVALLRQCDPRATFVTDKMPSNFRFVGLIRLMLPRAKIVHVRRDPADTCLSCYTKPFVEGQAFSFDLGELGRYYRAYDELMAHWRSVLDPGDMLEVQYERLVDDLEAQARRLLRYCGLGWDDACLRFHETDRAVATASTQQVRRPLYATSRRRWERFAPHLDALFAALGRGHRESGAA